MKDATLRIYDISVRMEWDIETASEYEKNIHNAIRFAVMRGKPLTIEYMDEGLNVVSTLKFKGDKKKFQEYEAKLEKTIKLAKGKQDEK